jgi:hypothetical protein
MWMNGKTRKDYHRDKYIPKKLGVNREEVKESSKLVLTMDSEDQ